MAKTGAIHRRGLWRSFEAAEYAALGWRYWFNRRLFEPIGKIPPAEAAANAHAALETDGMAAGSSRTSRRKTGRGGRDCRRHRLSGVGQVVLHGRTDAGNRRGRIVLIMSGLPFW
jgi:hypothetical protein